MTGGYVHRTRDERRKELGRLLLLPAKMLLGFGAFAIAMLLLGYRP